MGRGPIAQGFVDIVRLIGKMFIGGASKKGCNLSRAERKGQGAAETARLQQEIRAGTAVLGTFLALALAGVVYTCMPDPSKAPQPIERLPLEAAALKTVFFGAAPWVVECSAAASSAKSVLREAAAQRLLPAGLSAATLACDQPLASGATILETFKLKAPPPSSPPLLLQAGHGSSAPSPIKASSAAALVRHLKRWSAPTVVTLNTTLDLRRHCLSRPACLVLLTTGTPSSSAKATLLKAVGSSYRQLGVATLNRRTHTPSFASQIPQTERAVLLALRAASGTGAGVTAAALTAEARAFKGTVEKSNALEVESFVALAAKGTDFAALAAPPRITRVSRKGEEDGIHADELNDPLLTAKRWERETAL